MNTPEWTKEEKKPHFSVGAVIQDSAGNVLVQKHVKLQKWSLPGGKGNNQEEPYNALVREVQEECGITITSADCLTGRLVEFDRGNIKVPVQLYVYLVKTYTGTIQNIEPSKHAVQEFLNLRALAARGEPITYLAQLYLDILTVNGHIL